MASGVQLAERGEIEPKLRRVLSWLELNGVGVFWGRVEGQTGSLHANWDADFVPEVEPFLALSKEREARMMFVDCVRYDSDDLPETAVSAGPDELRQLAGKLDRHRGELVEVTISWVHERILFQYSMSASWADDYFSALEFSENSSDGTEDDDEDDELPDEAEVKRHAEVLARDAKFQNARTTGQKSYVARKILDESVIADKELFTAVLQEAKNIFEVEIKPSAEQELADQVENLKAQGLTKAQIARQLGISPSKMKTAF